VIQVKQFTAGFSLFFLFFGQPAKMLNNPIQPLHKSSQWRLKQEPTCEHSDRVGHGIQEFGHAVSRK